MSDENKVYFTAVSDFSGRGIRKYFHFFLKDSYLRENGRNFQDYADLSKSSEDYFSFMEEYNLSSDIDSHIFLPNMVTLKGSVPLDGIERLVITKKIEEELLEQIKEIKPNYLIISLP